MFDHALIFVADLLKSKDFYEKSFASLGYSIAFGKEGDFGSFDMGNGDLFEIALYNKKDTLTPCHIAFHAGSKEQVNAFYEASRKAGGKCNGQPGPRPHYTQHNYAAFVMEPSDHNIEAVFNPNT